MADRFSKKERSALMSSIKSKNTRFEQEFIIVLKKRFRRKLETHAVNIKGTPDIIFRKEKVCVFLDSDFWHGWHYAKWKNGLKDDFWRSKIERNRKRDRMVTRYLRREGWKVIRVWEHDIKRKPDYTISKVLQALKTG